MSGYTGNPDAESEQALIFAENGVHASRMMLQGRVLFHCNECGAPIPEARRAYALKEEMKCEYCVPCQAYHDKAPRIKMLDRIL
jgi:hypothetical protein